MKKIKDSISLLICTVVVLLMTACTAEDELVTTSVASSGESYGIQGAYRYFQSVEDQRGSQNQQHESLYL